MKIKYMTIRVEKVASPLTALHLPSRQSPLLRWCLLEGRGQVAVVDELICSQESQPG